MLTTFLGAALALTAAMLFVFANEYAKIANSCGGLRGEWPAAVATKAVAAPLVVAAVIAGVVALF